MDEAVTWRRMTRPYGQLWVSFDELRSWQWWASVGVREAVSECVNEMLLDVLVLRCSTNRKLVSRALLLETCQWNCSWFRSDKDLL